MFAFLCQNEFAARLSKVEAERQTLAESLTGVERRVTEERQRAEEFQQQAKSARVAADYAKQELQDYKNKASRILQVCQYILSLHSYFQPVCKNLNTTDQHEMLIRTWLHSGLTLGIFIFYLYSLVICLNILKSMPLLSSICVSQNINNSQNIKIWSLFHYWVFWCFKSKEKLISSLKESSGLEVLDGGGAVAGVELEELRHEKELQREEIQKLQAQIQSLRSEIQVDILLSSTAQKIDPKRIHYFLQKIINAAFEEVDLIY